MLENHLENFIDVGGTGVAHLHGLRVELQHEIVEVVAHRRVVDVLVDEVQARAFVETIGLGDEVSQGVLELRVGGDVSVHTAGILHVYPHHGLGILHRHSVGREEMSPVDVAPITAANKKCGHDNCRDKDESKQLSGHIYVPILTDFTYFTQVAIALKRLFGCKVSKNP